MEIEISFKDIIQCIRRGMFVIIAMAIVFGAVFFVYSKYVIEPTYETNIRFTSSSNEKDSSQINYLMTVAPQHIEFLKVPEFYQKVSEKILASNGEFYPAAEIKSYVSFSAIVQDTATFFVTVKTNDPETTYLVASAVATCAPERIKDINPDDVLVVFSSPTLPTSPSSPNVMKNTFLGFFLGVLIACVILVSKEVLDTRLKSANEITEIYKLPVLGTVPDISGSDKMNEGK